MLEAKSEKFWDLVGKDERIEKVAGGFEFTEGPVYSRRGYLLFSDIPRERIHRWQGGTVTVFREKSNKANGLTFDHQGRLLACEGGGRVTRTEKDGTITVLAGEGMGAPNDLVYNIEGSVYFTDLPRGRVFQITRERSGVGGVATRGVVRLAADDCERPNGVALSPNQQKLYVADVGKRVIRVYEIARDGRLRSGREFTAARGDGLKTDEMGNVWVASEDKVAVFDPGGALVGTITPPERPSNLCFGAGFRGVFITARTSVYRIGTKVPGTRTF